MVESLVGRGVKISAWLEGLANIKLHGPYVQCMVTIIIAIELRTMERSFQIKARH